LIRAALELIAQKGPAGFTFAEAARWAGVSPAAPGGANKRLAKPAHGFVLAAFLCKCRSELQGHHQIYEPSTRAGFSGGHHCNVAKHLAFVWCALMQRPECATLRAMGGVIHD
jgi:hypothetical protein